MENESSFARLDDTARAQAAQPHSPVLLALSAKKELASRPPLLVQLARTVLRGLPSGSSVRLGLISAPLAMMLSQTVCSATQASSVKEEVSLRPIAPVWLGSTVRQAQSPSMRTYVERGTSVL